MKKELVKKFTDKTCSDCGKGMKVFLYSDKTYRGGHYFGKIGISSEKEKAKSRSMGTREWKFDGHVFNVLKYDPKPYKYLEHWECPSCYWRYKKNHK